MWTMVLGAALLGTQDANAREYRLDARASGADIDGVVTMVPIEIDVTRPDYVLIVRFQNDTREPVVMHTSSMRCLRGELEIPVGHGAFGVGERWLDLMPGESKSVQLLCDHGSDATGDFGLVIPAILSNPSGDGQTAGEALVTDVVWRLQEEDVQPERQQSGEELSCLSYRRPASRVASMQPAPPPPVAAPSRPLAIPGNEPPPPPAALRRSPR